MKTLAAGAALLLVSGAASADVLDFNSLEAGTFVSNQFGDSNGVFIGANNPNRDFDVATIYDSLGSGGADPDLEGPPWEGGNLAPDRVSLGMMLIIAENIDDRDGDGLIDSPDDEGSRPAGSLIFEFTTVQTELGFDVIDLEDTELGSIELWLGRDQQTVIQFADFLDSNSPYYDASVDYGDNHANRLHILGPTSDIGYDRLVINLGGSAAIDNVVFAVPAPGTLALAAAGLVLTRRRR